VTVEVRLFATLARYLPPGSKSGRAVVELSDGAAIADLTRRLGIPATLECVLLLNGANVGTGALLHDGAVVDIFPPLAGGRSRRSDFVADSARVAGRALALIGHHPNEGIDFGPDQQRETRQIQPEHQ
jgi:molybdopterin converting factor small subunit